MRWTLRTALFASLVITALAGAQQQPQKLTRPEISPAVWGVLAVPAERGPHPGVILLPGSGGWNSTYADLAKLLGQSGFVTVALDYHAETGLSRADAADHAKKWTVWQQVVRNAVQYLRALPSVGDRPVALVGFSAGAFLAVSVASSIPPVKAVVDFFGGGGAGNEPLEKQVKGFPPLLIIHGEADTVVPVARARELRDAVLAQGGHVEIHLYPGAPHGFIAPSSPGYSKETAAEAFNIMVVFLHETLDR